MFERMLLKMVLDGLGRLKNAIKKAKWGNLEVKSSILATVALRDTY